MYSRELYPSTAPGTERETNEVYDTEFTNPVGFYPLSLDSHWSQANQNKTKAHSSGGPKYDILHPSSWGFTLLILWDRWLQQSDFSQSVSSVAQSCPTLCDPMNHSRPGLPAITNSQSLPKLMSIKSVMPFNHLILCHPLLLLPSIFPNIRVFSAESALCIRWPKYWSFSFNISPSNEHPGLISFRMD